jgi:L-threonylcarbamoyladenylate synthase
MVVAEYGSMSIAPMMVKQDDNKVTHFHTATLAADAAGIAAAVALLRAGQPVALPTETVYGLAADATDGTAVARIYAAKGRPAFNPLIVHLPDLAAVEQRVTLNHLVEKLAARFWPGPLTLVLPARAHNGIASLVSAGLPTLAVRVPAHPVMQQVLRDLGRPLAAPSANASGRLSPTRAAHVLASLNGKIAAVLDGGPSTSGLESTIIGFEGVTPVLLRAGAIAAEVIELTLGQKLGQHNNSTISAPGQLLHHYAPAKPLRLNATQATADETLIGFGNLASDLNLSPTGDLQEAASNLFDFLHQADALPAGGIAVAPIPHVGLGTAINDRLKRAVS